MRCLQCGPTPRPNTASHLTALRNGFARSNQLQDVPGLLYLSFVEP